MNFEGCTQNATAFFEVVFYTTLSAPLKNNISTVKQAYHVSFSFGQYNEPNGTF